MTDKNFPQFLIIGATRCGTSTLHEVLSSHPDICMPTVRKETEFFNRDEYYTQGLDHYAGYFSHAQKGQICGEASPPYLTKGNVIDVNGTYAFNKDNDPAQRIKKDFPDIKIIISLRNPVTRSHSQFSKNIWKGHESRTDFLTSLIDEKNGKITPQDSPLCWYYQNLYSVHLSYWFDLFPRENIHIMVFEEWTKDPANHIRALETFLGVAPRNLKDDDIMPANQGRRVIHPIFNPLIKLGHYNRYIRSFNQRFLTQKGYASLSKDVKKSVFNLFENDIQKTEKLIGRSLDVWRF